MTVSAEDILDFWFGAPPADAAALREFMKRCFGGDTRVDTEIRDRYEPAMSAAAASTLGEWATRPRGRLALILLLDQFPRNVYRGTAAAFAQDQLALELTSSGIEAGLDRHLEPLERLFFYMPLQHAESIREQDRSVAQFEALARSVEADFMAEVLAGAADYARQHRDIIAEFGRFPHRNVLLGRSSTAAELQFLERGGATFGQRSVPERPDTFDRAGDDLDA